MDKFDDYLEEKSTKEIEEFTLPESFDNKIEETLASLDKKENIAWYKDKKFWSAVACFSIICLAGFGINQVTNLGEGDSEMKLVENRSTTYDSSQPEMAKNDDLINFESQLESSDEQFMADEGINLEDINNIVFKEVQINNKYKVVSKKDDIQKIIDVINNIIVNPTEVQNLDDWDFLIQTNGSNSHSIIIQDNIMNIDDKWYEINLEGVNELLKIYDELNYGEDDIPFCDF